MHAAQLTLLMVQRLTKANSISCIEPLGLLSMAEHAVALGFETRIFTGDMYSARAFVEKEHRAASKRLHVIGLYCDFQNMSAVQCLARELKKSLPVSVFIGGPQSVGLDAEYLADCGADGVFRGEGEYAIAEILEAIEKGGRRDLARNLARISGLAAWIDGEFVDNGIRPPIGDLDALPPISGALSPLASGAAAMAVLSGRGCPFRCSFCYEGENGKTVRTRSVDHVMRELRSRLRYNPDVKYVFFGDDTFTLNWDRVNVFCDELEKLRREYDFIWFADGHVNILKKNPAMVKRMVEAGLARMQIGVESCCQPIIDIYNKNIRKEDLFTVIDICKEAKLPQLVGNIIIGGALETPETLRETVETVEAMYDRAGLMLEVTSTMYLPFPLTAMSKNPGRFGLKVLDPAGLTSSDDYPVAETPGLNLGEICTARRDFFKKTFGIMRRILDEGKITDAELLDYYRLERYSVVGLWHSFALSTRVYRHEQYRFRALAGAKLIRECGDDDYLFMRPRRVMPLMLTGSFVQEVPRIDGFVFAPFEERLLSLCSGKSTIAEIYDILAADWTGSREELEQTTRKTLETFEEKGFIVLQRRLDRLGRAHPPKTEAGRAGGGKKGDGGIFLLFHTEYWHPNDGDRAAGPASPGVFVLAAWLEKHGFDVRVHCGTVDEIPDVLSRFDPSGVLAVGLSVNHETASLCEKISRAIATDFGVPVLIGGVESTALGREFLERSRAAGIVVGEGEIGTLRALERIRDNRSFEEIPGLRYFDRQGVYHDNGNGKGETVENLDDVPPPAYHLSLTPFRFRQAYIMTGRGCPYSCAFCHEGSLERKPRRRSVGHVVAEMRSLLEKHPLLKTFLFCDDTLVSDREWVLELCGEIDELRKERPFTWYCEADVLSLDKNRDLLPAMAKSGMTQLQIGIESADPEMLRLYRKPLTPDMVERVVAAARDAGVRYVFGAFLVGGPHENPRHIKANMEFAEKLFRFAPACVQLAPSLVAPYPATDIARNPERYGLTIFDPRGLGSISDYPAMRSEEMTSREILAAYSGFVAFFIETIGKMLDDGTLGHKEILDAFVTSEMGISDYWKNMIVHHRPALNKFYTYLSKGAASRVEDVPESGFASWRPQRMVEMWHDVLFDEGFPRLAGMALSPFEFELLKYATGKLTFGEIADRSYKSFGEPAGEDRDAFMRRVREQYLRFSSKHQMLAVPY